MGKPQQPIYFPSHLIRKGRGLQGYTKQDLSKGKEEKYHWSTIGSVSISNKLFGQQVAEKINRKRTNLIVTEGQWDMLSVFQSLVDSVVGTKYEGIEPLVVSIPMGTANAVESLLHNEEYIKSHTAMTLFFDNDHCTPAELKKNIMKGKEARNAVAGAFIDSGIQTYKVVEAEGILKRFDYLQAGKSDLENLFNLVKKDYVAEKIIRASDISLKKFSLHGKRGCMLIVFLNYGKDHGFRTNCCFHLVALGRDSDFIVCICFYGSR